MTRLGRIARSKAAPFLLILAMILARWPAQKLLPFSDFDQPFYLGIAYDLVHAGRFTNGYFFEAPGSYGLRAPGMRFTPLYPSLLAATASIDGTMRAGMDCLVESRGKDTACTRAAPLIRGIQLAELAGILWLVWWMGCAAGSPETGWLALGLALLTVPLLLRSVGTLMTEMTCLAFSTAATAAGIAMLRTGGRGTLGWAAVSGGLLGLAALTRPAFLYLIPFCLLALGFAALRARPARMQSLRLACFASAAIGVLIPWFLRNTLVLGRPALTFGYDSSALVQRIAFDTMTRQEYGRAYVCWLPGGKSIGNGWFGPHACDRFGWDEQPASFYVLGVGRMLNETLAASGGYEHHLGYLLRTYVLAAPLTHIAVSVPLALRGAYVSHWWGFALLFAALAWTGLALHPPAWLRSRDPGWRPVFLAIALPAWFMLAFNALVAVNQVRYNLMLIPAYAVAGALSLGALHTWLGGWRRRAGI